MEIVDEVRIYPKASVTGRHGRVVDTGWDLHWPGPGRVYLHPREIAEAVRVGHVFEEVADVLVHVGWVPDAMHKRVVSELEAKAAALEQRADEAEKNLLAALQTIQIIPAVSPATSTTGTGINANPPAEPAPAQAEAVEPKPKTAKKKTKGA